MLSNQFQQAFPILEKLHNAGFEAYFVGGCVRDILIDLPIKDIDITTAATPEVVQSLFEKVIPVGIKHGTVIVRYEKKSFEVTTFRLDGKYSDEGTANQVDSVRSLKEDLKRRDFTMNALAMDKHGEIIDLFDGKKDIKNKIIRTVGNSNERFTEDALRIIRAFRFVSQLGFSIEKDTIKSMIDLKSKINDLPKERLLSEFEKMIQGHFVNESFALIQDLDFLPVLPCFLNIKEHFNRIVRDIKPLERFSSFIAYICFLQPVNQIGQWIKAWQGSNQMKNEANNLVKCLKLYEQSGLDNWLVYSINQELIKDFTQLVQMLFNENIDVEVIEEYKGVLQIRQRNHLAINGHDLMHIFPNQAPGPWLQELLDMLEYQVVQQKLKNDYYKLKEWIKCNPPETN